MLLGLPAHLAPQSTGRALARSCHVIACVVLAGAALLLVSNQVGMPSLILWPALVAVVTMAALVVVVATYRSATSYAAYLLLGSACLYWYALTLFAQVPSIQASDAFSLSLPKIALVMVGASGVRPRHSIAWATGGLVLGEVATQLATWQTGSAPKVDVTTVVAWAVVVGTLGYALVARDRARRAQPSIHRAAVDQQLQSIRHDMEQQAAALVHDTVLNHLAAVATAGPGRLDRSLASSMAADLETLVGQEWLRDPAPPGVDAATAEWDDSLLARAVEQGRARGLEIGVTGDVAAVARLAPVVGQALGLAVTQCLTNVEKHSGVRRAEVVVYGDGGELSVMVIDDGAGFDQDAVPRDRLGLSNSVRARMERVGGSAQVWSSPGSGTSVVIRVPATGPDGPEVPQGPGATGATVPVPGAEGASDVARSDDRTGDAA
ncbi:sensor histidine kinase [Frigoribacterium endophyticum]|uniref:sensor histidine kinase n=1 Tax=Frigoribacterium endophyticum TaxID=1522176 RepID=UPI00141E3FED|nr:ATP-binding protein [Frigoribacterium endophyticum]NII50098.1 signal transduction histidine kinase [Frigoribacterium endophyticum]